MAHLKRLTVPNSWSIRKKDTTFIATPMPGPHKKNECITLNLALKDFLNMANTTREVKKILQQNLVYVDGVPRKDYRFPVGLMDIISIPSIHQSYMVMYSDKGKFMLKKLDTDPKEKSCKIIGKHTLRKKKIQINLYDGKNIVVDKDSYKVGDTVIVAEGKIKRHIKLEKGSLIYLTGGKHIGKVGKLIDITKFKGMENDRIIMETKEGKIETLKDYVFVIEKVW